MTTQPPAGHVNITSRVDRISYGHAWRDETGQPHAAINIGLSWLELQNAAAARELITAATTAAAALDELERQHHPEAGPTAGTVAAAGGAASTDPSPAEPAAFRCGDRVIGPKGAGTVVNTAHFSNAPQVQYDAGGYVYEPIESLTPAPPAPPAGRTDGSVHDGGAM